MPASAAITAAMVGILVASNRGPSGVLTDFLANPIVLEFLMGMWLGVFHLTYRRGQSSTYRSKILAMIGVGSILLSSMIVPTDSTAGLPAWPRVFAWGVPALLMLIYFIGMDRPSTRLSTFFAKIGDSSYSLYLTHPFVMISYAFSLKFAPINQLSQIFQIVFVVTAVILSIFLGLIVHLFVERPIMGVLSLSRKPKYSSA